ncbi:MAG: nitrogen fixation protein NifX [Kineosporiaceae bacterium]
MLTIAIATRDGTAVDQHFGWCTRFDVYQVDAEHAELVQTRAPGSAEGEDAKIASRLDAIRDCAIVHVTAIGPTAAARVVKAGLMPVKMPEGTPVAEVLTRLQEVLGGTPPPWIRKVLRQHSPDATAWTPA